MTKERMNESHLSIHPSILACTHSLTHSQIGWLNLCVHSVGRSLGQRDGPHHIPNTYTHPYHNSRHCNAQCPSVRSCVMQSAISNGWRDAMAST